LETSENIGNLFFCSSLLEKKTYELYYELSQRVDGSDIKPILVAIAQDSLKHCNLFEEISKDLISKNPNQKTCQANFGKTWTQIEEITKLVKQKKFLNEEELFEIINRLAFIENSLGEEYSTLEKTKMLRYMHKEISEKYSIDLSSQKDVLDSIISDEKQHINYLLEIHEKLKTKQPKAKNHPEFKYQNPDAWWIPSHSQKTKHVI
jgi:rubrerythrin